MRLLLVLGIVLGACSFTAGDNFHPGDGSSGDDAIDAAIDAIPIDAARPITLSETTSDDPSSGKSVFCNNGQLMRDNTWYREFRPSDHNVTTTFHLTSVHYSSELARGLPSVTISVYRYSGTLGAATIDVTALTGLAATTQGIPDSESPQDLDTAIAADIPGGASFVIGIASTDVQTGTGTLLTAFHLGANAAGETAPSYYASGACGTNMPTAQGGADFIIDATGVF